MESFFQYAADIIRAAATSPLGILALLILVTGVLAFLFFKDAPILVRFLIFVMIFGAVCSFGGAVLRKTQTAAVEQAKSAAQQAAMQTLLLTNTKRPVAILYPPSNIKFETNTPPTVVSAEARNNIAWVFEDAGAKQTYETAVSRGLSRYQAVLAAQGHNPSAQETVAAVGEAQTDELIKSLGH
jgi:hypothetical protein